jgi:type I restriction enzyme S subunit
VSFPRYPEYTPTGHEVLKEVPLGWRALPLRAVGRLLKGYGGSKEDIVEYGLPCVRYGDLYTTHSTFIQASRTRIAEENAANYAQINVGDVLFAGSGETFEDIGKSAVNVIDGRAFCGGDLIIFRPAPGIDHRFLGYACDSRNAILQKIAMGRGTTVKHIYPDELRHLTIALPPASEQESIAAFLDRETAKIDALIAEQERLIELLKEKRQSFISHAVTKGLDPNAPMKPSGIEWLGDVPAHWNICLVKRLLESVDYGISESLHPSGAIAVLRMGNIAGGAIVLDDLKFIDSVDSALLLSPGDLLYNRTNSLSLIGKVGLFERYDLGPITFASYLVRLRPNQRAHPPYLAHVLNTDAFLAVGRSLALVAIGQCNLNPTRYGEIPIAIPPMSAQREIVDYLQERLAELESKTNDGHVLVRLLLERRSALISAAVTGEIDVRGA